MIDTMLLSEIKRVENSRSEVGNLADLMRSIKSKGVIQPLIVCDDYTDKRSKKKLLVAGNRRYEAAYKLRMKEVPVIVTDKVKNEKDFILVNLSENLHRKDISAYETGRYIYKLTKSHNMTVEECSVSLGISKAKTGDLINAYERTPKEYRESIVANSKGQIVPAGKVSLRTAVTINNLLKSNCITKAQARQLYQYASSKAYSDKNVARVSKEVRSGKRFNTAVNQEKNVTARNVMLQVRNSDLQKHLKQGQTFQSLIEEMVYGETTKRFRRV